MKQQNGFVLISTVLLSLLLSSIVLFMLNSGLIAYRMSYGVWQYYQREAALMAGIHAGMAVLDSGKPVSCYPIIPVEKWWQQPQVCIGSFDRYSYQFIIFPLNSPLHCLHYIQINSAVLGFTDHFLQVTLLHIDWTGMRAHRCAITPAELALLAKMRTQSTWVRLSWHEVPMA